jgi:hypothetical protein
VLDADEQAATDGLPVTYEQLSAGVHVSTVTCSKPRRPWLL